MIQQAWDNQNTSYMCVNIKLEAICYLQMLLFGGNNAGEWGAHIDGHQDGWDPASEFNEGNISQTDG